MSSAVAPSTRERLIAAMLDALRTRGLHGVGLNELLAAAQAPKGVLYHHFPGGKTELAVAAIDTVADQLAADLDRLAASGADPLAALSSWMAGAGRALVRSGFARGCPLATVALESTPQDTALREALARAFARIRERLASAFVAAGRSPDSALDLASLVVATYEGALLQARVAADPDTMTRSTHALLALLAPHLAAAAPPSQEDSRS